MTIDANLYETTAPAAPATGPLDGDLETDFLLVGAGFTGLSAALRAAGDGIATVVIEAKRIGEGGSGRNHGHCVPVFGYLDPEGARARLGEERGARWTDLLVRSGEEVFRLVRKHGIACEAAPTGTLHLAHNAAAVARIERQHAFYERLGRKPILIDKAEAERLTGSPIYHGGWIHPDGGHLNPLAYARGLARAALEAGASIFTDTPALDLVRDGDRWRVKTPKGSIRAKIVAIATNGYTERFAAPLGSTYFTMDAYAIASAPIDPKLREVLLPGNHNVGDTRPDIHFYRFDAQNRLIVGGLVEPRLGTDLAHTVAYMTRRMRRVFPMLDTISWDYRWSGRLCANLSVRPQLYNPAEGLYALLGYSGRGVPTATALGAVLAEAATGRPANELPMEISPVRRLIGAPLFSALVPRIRGPYKRMLGALGF